MFKVANDCKLTLRPNAIVDPSQPASVSFIVDAMQSAVFLLLMFCPA